MHSTSNLNDWLAYSIVPDQLTTTLLPALLRKGNVHSEDDWRSVLEPVIERSLPA